MNILKTFEMFLMEPLTVLTKRIVQIVSVETPDAQKGEISAELNENKAQITVVNNKKVYNLLKTAMYKHEKKAEAKMVEALKKNTPIVPFGQLLLRQSRY